MYIYIYIHIYICIQTDWFRQGAKAAKLNGGALNNHTQASLLDQYAAIAQIQENLAQKIEASSGGASSFDERPQLLARLQRELFSVRV